MQHRGQAGGPCPAWAREGPRSTPTGGATSHGAARSCWHRSAAELPVEDDCLTAHRIGREPVPATLTTFDDQCFADMNVMVQAFTIGGRDIDRSECAVSAGDGDTQARAKHHRAPFPNTHSPSVRDDPFGRRDRHRCRQGVGRATGHRGNRRRGSRSCRIRGRLRSWGTSNLRNSKNQCEDSPSRTESPGHPASTRSCKQWIRSPDDVANGGQTNHPQQQ